jgi:hypothetical protein
MVFATDDIGNRYTIGTERTRRGQNGKMENEKMGKREKGRTQKRADSIGSFLLLWKGVIKDWFFGRIRKRALQKPVAL